MSRGRQTHLFKEKPFEKYNRLEHGARLNAGKRKEFRPIDPRRPLHVVMRSERAKGEWSMLRPRHEKQVKHLVHWAARRHGVKVHRFANSGNHLHLVVHAKTRVAHQNYLRTLAAMIARKVTGACKGNPKGKFWDELAYSKVVNWGRHLETLDFYVIMNELEGLGIWSRKWARSEPKRARPADRDGSEPPVPA